MQTPPRIADRPSAAHHLVLFDGACGFCRRAVLSAARLDSAGAFHFASLDSGLARNLLAERDISPSGANSVLVLPGWQHSRQPVLDRSAAALFIARRLAWPWKGFAALGILPQPLLDACYDTVARNRHRLTSGADACAIPDAAIQDRFLP